MTRFASALVLVLACSAIFGSTAASAAQTTTLELNCSPPEQVAGARVSCEALATAPVPIAPTGDVRFERFGFADIRPRKCTLSPISPNESSCVLPFRITAELLDLEILAFYDAGGPEPLIAEAIFHVAPGGSIRIGCSPDAGFPGLPTTCEIFVPNTPGVSESPSGIVRFRSEPTFGEDTTGRIDSACTLEAVPGGARCGVTFVPAPPPSPVGIGIVADYEGDASHPAQFGSLVYLVFEKHQTNISGSCDPAPSNTFAPTTCTATVVNTSGQGGAPTGFVEIAVDPADGIFPVGRGCALQPVEDGPKASESSCQIKYQPIRTGAQTLDFHYPGVPLFEEAHSSLEIEVVSLRNTTTGLTCVAQTSTAAGICLVTVGDTSANPVAPAGTVKLNAPAGVTLNRETCTVSPNTKTATSSCAFSYTMDAVGSAPVVAEYSGDKKTGHLPSSRQALVSRRS